MIERKLSDIFISGIEVSRMNKNVQYKVRLSHWTE